MNEHTVIQYCIYVRKALVVANRHNKGMLVGPRKTVCVQKMERFDVSVGCFLSALILLWTKVKNGRGDCFWQLQN